MPNAIVLGKGFFTALGMFLEALGAALANLGPLYGGAGLLAQILIALGTIVVFAAQTLFEAGIIPEFRKATVVNWTQVITKSSLTALGSFIATIGAAFQAQGGTMATVGLLLIAIGTITVFAAQTLWEHGLIPAKH